MRNAFLASVAAGALAATTAQAADFSRLLSQAAPVYSWTGCYIGGHVGWGWSRTTMSGFPSATTGISTLFTANPSFTSKTSGAVFGGQVGCDYQFAGNFVLGVSGSAAAANISGFSDQPLGSLLLPKTDSLVDVSGRLGYSWGSWLLYAKGGAAWAHDSLALSFLTGNKTLSGALVGGGAEWTFAQSWSAFVEYNHYFFNNTNVTFSGPLIIVNNAGLTVSQSIDSAKVGVNYHFK
jgi:outer membrane immunogenic protein